jgi:hypothetical protein
MEKHGVVPPITASFVTWEKYDESISRLEAAGQWPLDGLQLHVLFGSEDDLKMKEIWDSQEQLQAFGDG